MSIVPARVQPAGMLEACSTTPRLPVPASPLQGRPAGQQTSDLLDKATEPCSTMYHALARVLVIAGSYHCGLTVTLLDGTAQK